MRERFFVMLCSPCLLSVAAVCAEPTDFKKGQIIGNLGIGVGTHRLNGNGGGTFTQKASFEYGLGQIAKNVSLGVGFAIANSYGDKTETTLYGTYDYYVNTTMYHYHKNSAGRWTTESYAGAKIHRQGVGTVDASVASDDIKLMPTLSLHYKFSSKLEAYATIGAGVSVLNGIVSDEHNYQGMGKEEKVSDIKTGTMKEQYSLTYKYDDLDHAKIVGGEFHKVGGAFAFNVGARYYFTPRLAAFGELGINAVSLKKDYARSWDILTIGCTYKF